MPDVLSWLPTASLVPLPGQAALTRLPTPLSSLVGREREVSAVAMLLGDPTVRLLTLTGPGGVGKTRLALASAAGSAARFADGIAFVGLAPVTDPALVGATIAQALGVRSAGPRPVAETLAAVLSAARVLLVLDNVEQVLAAAPLVAALLGACPALTILVTSRERLRLSGERVYPVSPLPVPATHEAATAAQAATTASVQLFVTRAQETTPAFALTDAEAPAVAEICRRLDGLPLAIELAAARIAVVSPRSLLARLESRLPLLTGGPLDAPARQRTMRDAIAWSHDLLTAAEQGLFRRLSVFVDGFSLEAAEAVSREYDVLSLDPRRSSLDSVGSLVAKSLVRQQMSADGEPRYRMLETIREFAQERLAASGEGDAAHQVHAGYFLRFAERHRLTPFVSVDKPTFDRLETEHANLRAALGWLEATGRTSDAARMTGALGWFWFVNSHLRDALPWLERANEHGEAVTAGDRVTNAVMLAIFLLARGETPRAERLAANGLAYARAAGDDLGSAHALTVQGILATGQERFDEAVPMLEEAVSLARSLADRRLALAMASSALANLGVAKRGQGRLTEAIAMHQDALAGHRAVGSARGEMNALADLSDAASEQGDHVNAARYGRAALDMAWDFGERRAIAAVLESLACTAAALGDAGRAARLFGAADRLREVTGIGIWLMLNRAACERGTAAAREALGLEAFEAAWHAGRALPLEQAVAEALAVEPPPESAPPPLSVTLTPRESEILPLLVAGQTDPAIAEALFISVRTVEHHVARILAKLDVRTRTAAVSAAVAAGLVPNKFDED